MQHAFAAAGPHNVTVTSQDGVGNGASTTRTVQIQDPPASAPLPAPAQVAFGGIDADRDGFFSNQDCNDNNATIRPSAQELRGNRIDENCDGRADDFLATVGRTGRCALIGLRLRVLSGPVSVGGPSRALLAPRL